MVGGVVVQAGDGVGGHLAHVDGRGTCRGAGAVKRRGRGAVLLVIEFVAFHRFRVGGPGESIVLGHGRCTRQQAEPDQAEGEQEGGAAAGCGLRWVGGAGGGVVHGVHFGSVSGFDVSPGGPGCCVSLAGWIPGCTGSGIQPVVVVGHSVWSKAR